MISSKYIIQNITKYYSDTSHIVLKNLSLEISADDITVVLGASGCGKTTLLRIIAGLEEASSGEISFIKDGEVVKPKAGLIFQESRLMPWLNVYENISFYERKKNTLKRVFMKNRRNHLFDKEQINDYLKMMKLDEFKNYYPHELSGGMSQRVSIARALYYNPDILLMDEPFSALDYFSRFDMQNELIRIHELMHKGVIFVTHDIDEALKIAKKIIIFSENYKVYEIKIKDNFNRNLSDEYYINLKNKILNMFK